MLASTAFAWERLLPDVSTVFKIYNINNVRMSSSNSTFILKIFKFTLLK